ncbi:hypothetical protein HCX48_05915 [Rhodocyclus tenuis]|uniref:Winged helix-turn-helix domain-containing protein n=1 Tax=Rhodocyclus gracilis TaxID=2929842 RepID=A0ABX0WHD5_9RHOO|nr:hypothetical protein [Rhodocyclus gracilis]NJA88760.1 hypothetical protein [Rhodocyclus gracilis]
MSATQRSSSRSAVPAVERSPAMQRILRLLGRKSNMAVSDMSAEAFVGATTLACGGYVRALKSAKLIHISGWRKTRRGFSTPLYSAGHKPDMPRPEYDDSERNAPGMERIVSAMQRLGPMNYRQIADASGLSLNTLKNAGYLDALRTQKRIHICGWQRARNGPMSALYDLGASADVPKPQTLSAAEKNRRCRERKHILCGDRSLLAQLGAVAQL